MLRSDLCDYIVAYVVVKGRITVEGDKDAKTRIKSSSSKIMLHLDYAYQKLTHL